MNIYLLFLFAAGFFTLYFLATKDFLFALIFLSFTIIFAFQSKLNLKKIIKKPKKKISTSLSFSFPKNPKMLLLLVPIIIVALVMIKNSFWPSYRLSPLPSSTPLVDIQKESSSSTTGQTTDKIAQLEQKINLEPENMDNYYQLSRLYEENNQVDKAIALFENLTKKRADDIPIFHRLADIYVYAGNEKKAIEVLEKTVQIQPQNPAVLTKFGSTLIELKKPEQAIEKLDKAISLDPNFGEAYYLLVIAYKFTNNEQKMLQTLETCLEKTDSQSIWRQKCQELKAAQ